MKLWPIRAKNRVKVEAKEFIEQINTIKDYWLEQEKDKKDTLEGFVFSLLSMIDGECGINDCHGIELKDEQTGAVINKGIYLHEVLLQVKEDRGE